MKNKRTSKWNNDQRSRITHSMYVADAQHGMCVFLDHAVWEQTAVSASLYGQTVDSCWTVHSSVQRCEGG